MLDKVILFLRGREGVEGDYRVLESVWILSR